MAGSAMAERVRAVIEPGVRDLGLVLEDLQVTAAGRRRRVLVVVDLDDEAIGGTPMDTVASASQAVSQALDASDVMGENPYLLEVTSPGVDRPLTQPRHWRRARTRTVTAVLRDGRTLTGRLLDAGADGLLLEGHGQLPWELVARGRTEVEFSRPDDEPDEPDELDELDDESDEPDEESGELDDQEDEDGEQNEGGRA